MAQQGSSYTPYKTQRFSFIGSPQQRNGGYTKDQRFINVYPELIQSPMTEGKKYYLKKRPGLQPLVTFPAGTAQGIIRWNGHYYTAINGQLYKDNSLILVLSQTTQPVGFAAFRSDSQNSLFVCDGTKGWVIDISGTIALIVDANFPSPHLPYPIFLDGYIFLAQTSSQIIRNSTLQDPMTWPTDGFIDAEMYPDNLVALTKNQNYLVAMGTESCEFFYDNANATGSPLQRNAPAVAQIGLAAAGSVQQTEKEFIFVGNTEVGGQTVWSVDGFQPTQIASEPVREALDQEGDAIGSVTAMVIQCAGHKWYVMNLYRNFRTFVYDFEEKMWHEWMGGDGSVQFLFDYKYSTQNDQGNPVVLGDNSGIVSTMSADVWQDNGAVIYCAVITSKIDFDTNQRKTFFQMRMVGDSPNGNTDSPITVSWSDDDYNTWSAGRTLEMNGYNPMISQLGRSRRRAFKFEFSQPLPLRLESFELDITEETRR